MSSTYIGSGLYSTTSTGTAALDVETNLVPKMASAAQFTVYIAGGNYKVRDWVGGTTTTNASCDTLVNNLMTAQSTTGAHISFLPGFYVLQNPLSVPLGTGGNPFVFTGVNPAIGRGNSPTFQVGNSFPTQRYVIESVAALSSNQHPAFHIDGLFFYNPNFKTLGTIDAGGIKLEFDGGGAPFPGAKISNCTFQYMWRGIHILGITYAGWIHDCQIIDANASFVGDCDIRFEQNGHPDRPKCYDIRNIWCTHSPGAVMNNSLYLAGSGYHLVSNYFIDSSSAQLEAPFALHGETETCHDNRFERIWALDLPIGSIGTLAPAAKGGIYINGSNCYDNSFIFTQTPGWPKMVNFANNSLRNKVQLTYFGAPVSIEDTGCGPYNVVEVDEGANPSAAGTNTKITSTTSSVLIRDRRTGASNAGATQASGNGSTTAFTISHGLFTTPLWATVTPGSSVANAPFYISALGATTITVTYTTAPASGTNNLTWYWRASVYPSG